MVYNKVLCSVEVRLSDRLQTSPLSMLTNAVHQPALIFRTVHVPEGQEVTSAVNMEAKKSVVCSTVLKMQGRLMLKTCSGQATYSM